MSDPFIEKELEILSKKELNRTIKRLASQILEKVTDTSSLLLVGIPNRGVYLSQLLLYRVVKPIKKINSNLEKNISITLL